MLLGEVTYSDICSQALCVSFACWHLFFLVENKKAGKSHLSAKCGFSMSLSHVSFQLDTAFAKFWLSGALVLW